MTARDTKESKNLLVFDKPSYKMRGLPVCRRLRYGVADDSPGPPFTPHIPPGGASGGLPHLHNAPAGLPCAP